MGGGKGSNKTKSTFTLPPEFIKAYNESLGLARQAIQQPYQQYQGQLVAGLTPGQQQGIANIQAAQGMALPFIQEGAGLTREAARGITPDLYERFYSPYVRDVASATQANLLESAAQQRSGLKGGAIQAGAFGGDRAGIAQAEMARQQQLANAQAMANIYNQGYGQAMGLAGQQVANLGAMGQQMAGLGTAAQGSALQGAQAQMAAGAQEQATAQAQLQAAYDQFLRQQSYPFQIAQYFANIAQGLGSTAGGTSTTTAPAPNQTSGILGAIGALGSIASMFPSDKRAKENIEAVGTLNDGQTVYRYNFKGDPKTQIGLLAQEVEQRKPGAVAEVKGLKMVDYKDATDDAASSMGGVVSPGIERSGLAGGGVPFMPYSGGSTYIPEGKIGGGGGSAIPKAPEAYQDKGLAEDWQSIKPLTEDQIGGFARMGRAVGLLPGVYARGGVAGRGGYQFGGVPTMEDAMAEAEAMREPQGLGAAEYPRLIQKESGGDYGARNKQGYVGRAQFGDARLEDARRAGVLPEGMDKESFRLNPQAQQDVEKWHFSDINNFIDKRGLGAFEGKTIGGVPVTREGLVNVAHLGGKGGLEKFITSGGSYNPADANGTRLSDYLAMGAQSGGVGAAPAPTGYSDAQIMPVSAEAAPEGVAAAEKDRTPFSLKNLFASDERPSIVEQIMGRRLSPEARAAMLNASFALMAGRSPYFMTNLGEAGRVGTQSYYNALQQKKAQEQQAAELAQQQYGAETSRMVAETAREKAIREQEQAIREQEEEAARQQMLEEAIAQLPPDQQTAARLAPEKFFEQQVKTMFPEAPPSGGWGGTIIPLRNRETGEIVPGQFNQNTGGVFINGEPADPNQWAFDPAALAQEKAAGSAIGTQMGGAAAEIPGAEVDVDALNATIDVLVNNPSLGDAIGYGNILSDYLVSNDVLQIRSELNKLEGGAFLNAYTTLKGGGAITEMESDQAKKAIADMQTARKMSDPQMFIEALESLRDAFNRGIVKLRAKAGRYAPQTGPSPAGEQGGQPEYNFNPETGELE